MTESHTHRNHLFIPRVGRFALFACCWALLSPCAVAQFRLKEPGAEAPEEPAAKKSDRKLTAPIVRRRAPQTAANRVEQPKSDEESSDAQEMAEQPTSEEPAEPTEPDSEVGSDLPSASRRIEPAKNPARIAAASSRVADSEPVELIEQDPEPNDFFTGAVPRTRAILDDAALRDVCLVGNFCCAVGDRGVIAISRDAGESWSTKAIAIDCQLLSVCFLTDRVGWIGGWARSRQNSEPQCVLLETRDGGESWKRLLGPPAVSGSSSIPAASLPGLMHVEYFGLDEAAAVTMSSERLGSKRIFQSQDGGQTWTAVVADDASEEWLSADFVSPAEGIVGGARDCYAAVVASQAVVINTPQKTLRGIRGASLDASGVGWLVGDGASIVRTENAGVTWQTPDGDRPEDFSKLADLRTVAHDQGLVLAAGAPGSCFLRSDDGGQSWDLVAAPATGLLHRVRIQPDGIALAVGSFGQILRSVDRGVTWQSVRSEHRRAGVLNLTGNASDISWNLLARTGGDDGIRTAVVQMSQPLEPGIESVQQQWHFRSHAAISSLGLCDGASDWMFARTRPEANRSAMTLVQEWDRQTDGQLRELLPLRLARQLRIWRPSVVVVEPSRHAGLQNDAVASVLRDALPRAIELAADEQHPMLGGVHLSAWSVPRVVTRTQREATSGIRFAESDLLPRLRTTSGLLVDFARGPNEDLQKASSSQSNECHYEITYDQNSMTSAKHLFDGLTDALDSASRRAIPSFDREHSKELTKIVTSAKLEASSLAGNMTMVGGDGTLIAQLESVGESLPESLALRQLRELGELNLQRNNMEGYLSVQQEIIRRFPESIDAQKAAADLLMFYSSAETRRYRMQGQMNAAATGQSKPGDSAATPQMTGPFQSNAANHLDALQQRWDENAVTAFRVLSQTPAGANSGDEPGRLSAEVLLRQAVNFARQGMHGDHGTMLADVSRMSEPLATFARAEMQITHGAAVPEIPTFNVPRRKEPPFLDGKLTDTIWEAAEEIRLSDVSSGASQNDAGADQDLSSLVMLGSDEEHLYVAGVFTLNDQVNRRITLATHRSHDADHGEKDRFELEVDTDRDYSTSFQFTIDESGLTSDRCWMLDRWNPTWYVDVKRDEKSWRFEAAIPLRELAMQQPRLGTVWGIRLRRIQPGQHRHELLPASGIPTHGTGLIRFIRPKAMTRG